MDNQQQLTNKWRTIVMSIYSVFGFIHAIFLLYAMLGTDQYGYVYLYNVFPAIILYIIGCVSSVWQHSQFNKNIALRLYCFSMILFYMLWLIDLFVEIGGDDDYCDEYKDCKGHLVGVYGPIISYAIVLSLFMLYEDMKSLKMQGHQTHQVQYDAQQPGPGQLSYRQPMMGGPTANHA